jgi:hypothetical protein
MPTPTVDTYARKYPGVPKEVILKEDLLRLGLAFTDAAMEAARGCRTQAYYLFSYNISHHDDLKKGMSTAAPEDLIFRGGPHDLKRHECPGRAQSELTLRRGHRGRAWSRSVRMATRLQRPLPGEA